MYLPNPKSPVLMMILSCRSKTILSKWARERIWNKPIAQNQNPKTQTWPRGVCIFERCIRHSNTLHLRLSALKCMPLWSGLHYFQSSVRNFEKYPTNRLISIQASTSHMVKLTRVNKGLWIPATPTLTLHFAIYTPPFHYFKGPEKFPKTLDKTIG